MYVTLRLSGVFHLTKLWLSGENTWQAQWICLLLILCMLLCACPWKHLTGAVWICLLLILCMLLCACPWKHLTGVVF